MISLLSSQQQPDIHSFLIQSELTYFNNHFLQIVQSYPESIQSFHFTDLSILISFNQSSYLQQASEAIQKAVDAKVDEMTTQMELQKESMEEDYQQSLGIAAVAVNENLFDDTKNVLAEDLIDNLEQIGVEDARDIVESSFKNYGEEYLRTIVAKASEYKSKSAEVRNELANTVMASNFKSGKLNMNHVATASVKESLNAEDVNKYRSLFNKK